MAHRREPGQRCMRLSMAGHHVRLVGPVGTDAMGVSDAMAAKIRNALALYRPLRAAGGVKFRFHRTILYNSIYRADDQVLVNTHLFGVTAAHTPVWHLRKLPAGELAGLYIDSFERVWETATGVAVSSSARSTVRVTAAGVAEGILLVGCAAAGWAAAGGTERRARQVGCLSMAAHLP